MHSQGVGREVNQDWVRRIGQRVVREEGEKKKGVLSIVLVDDTTIQELNRRFLKKDRPTDVIAFPLGDEEEGVWGEVYVNQERAREQAGKYGVSFEEELARLIVHGVLHLVNYGDADTGSRRRMREREDYYLTRIFSENRSIDEL